MKMRGKRPDMRDLLLFLLIVCATILTTITRLITLDTMPSVVFPVISIPKSNSSPLIQMFILGAIILAVTVLFFGSKKALRHWLIRVVEALLFYKESTLLLSGLIVAVFIIVYTTELHPIIAQNIQIFLTIITIVLGEALVGRRKAYFNGEKKGRRLWKKWILHSWMLPP